LTELHHPEPSPSEAAYRQGYALFQMRRPAEALEPLRHAAALDPSDPRPLCMISAAHIRLGQPEEALRAATDAVTREPELGWAHRLRATSLHKLGRAREAKEAALEAVRIEPEEPNAYVVLSEALQASGDEAGALAAARHAVALNPEATVTHNALGNILLKHEQPEAAEAEFRAALAIDPEDSIALNNLAAALGRQRQIPEMVRGFERASQADPAYALPRKNLLQLGRRMQWPRHMAIGCLLLAVVLGVVSRGSGRWALVAFFVGLAVALESVRLSLRRQLSSPARTLIADDARARRLRPAQWDWSWPTRLRPWWWILLSRLPPPVALVLTLALFVLALVATRRSPLLLAVLGLALVGSAGRAWRAWRRVHPGGDSWRAPEPRSEEQSSVPSRR
jgi:tetratricopeptide (TPR) repeat protein